MSTAIHRNLIKPALVVHSHWEPWFDALISNRPHCLSDHWSHMHDVLFLTVAKNLGSIAMLSDVLADHRLHGRNVTQAKTWKQPDEIQNRWGTGQHARYRMESAFCADLARYLLELPQDMGVGRAPAEMSKHYEEWSRRWTLRAEVHDRHRKLRHRIGSFWEMIATGGYRPKRDGGVGVQSLFKDGAAATGVFPSGDRQV